MANATGANRLVQLLFVIIIITDIALAVPAQLTPASFENDESIEGHENHENDNRRSFYQECTSNVDCPESYCCTVGMMRFTVPFCTPLGTRDEPCRPDNEPQNITLSFPKSEMNVIESYLLLCPCEKGLSCSRDTASCVTRHETLDEN